MGERDNHVYNNYIYHILHNYDNLTQEFYSKNYRKVSLLSYSNYFVDTNNVTSSHNFNLEYSKDNFMNYFKLNTNYLKNENNSVFINLFNKHTDSTLILNTQDYESDHYKVRFYISMYPHYYKK